MNFPPFTVNKLFKFSAQGSYLAPFVGNGTKKKYSLRLSLCPVKPSVIFLFDGLGQVLISSNLVQKWVVFCLNKFKLDKLVGMCSKFIKTFKKKSIEQFQSSRGLCKTQISYKPVPNVLVVSSISNLKSILTCFQSCLLADLNSKGVQKVNKNKGEMS